MPVEITIPSPGESITEVVLGPWQKQSGAWVQKDDALVEIESDKVTLEVPSPESGLLTITADEGAELRVGDVIGTIDPSATPPSNGDAKSAGNGAGKGAKASADEPASPDAAAVEAAVSTASKAAVPDASDDANGRATPLARKVAADQGVTLASVKGTGPSGRITKSDVLAATRNTGGLPAVRDAAPAAANTGLAARSGDAPRGVRREKMSKLRQRVAQRLVEAQHNAAMLTTFNEVDMSEVMRLRSLHKEAFQERHGIGLGFMSFFVKAACSALAEYPGINAYIDGDEVEYHDFCDISVAVGTPKGLVVPIVRNAEQLDFAGIELAIKDLAIRARDGKLTLDDMTGGTFTISNGGVYGSLMSTPILNPPQSGILGMHKIMKRAVEDAKNPGQIVLRPMMYLALSYDHRIVDGEQAVRFLVHLKDRLENPERLLLGL